eukprot:2407284-Pyramimonas_sp.AAC.1
MRQPSPETDATPGVGAASAASRPGPCGAATPLVPGVSPGWISRVCTLKRATSTGSGAISGRGSIGHLSGSLPGTVDKMLNKLYSQAQLKSNLKKLFKCAPEYLRTSCVCVGSDVAKSCVAKGPLSVAVWSHGTSLAPAVFQYLHNVTYPFRRRTLRTIRRAYALSRRRFQN